MTNTLINDLKKYLNARIVGQERFIERLLLALFADGHILLEGAPGLAKTKAVTTLSEILECDAQRIQFTPDLLPGDLTGTDIYRPERGSFEFQQGPLFHNLILADEINRAPAKVQSALLEAMAERQVTVGGKTYPLPALFMVLATQNPIEQEGTYPLPEAQLDRFLLHVNIDYPDADAEREILRLIHDEALGIKNPPERLITNEEIFAARQAALQVHVSEALSTYIIQLIQATRQPSSDNPVLADAIAYGASPRATIAMDRCARVHAWMNGADFATPANVQAIAHDVLRHRILLSFEAEAAGKTTDAIISELLAQVPVI
ncbi:MAG: AAA family ATPase [Gammaproteobacteria bacterium]|nr:MAG: AAA family ATPase [Gammaproteobacteria bacterium]